MRGLFPFMMGRVAMADPPDAEPMRTPIEPDQPFVAIGDIHGCADLLRELDRLIEAHCASWPVVFLGDYVDRGEQSREVLELLMSVSPESTPSVTCLMGNHERMLLEFLNDPAANGPRWLRNGGLQTLASFGVALKGGDTKDPAVFKDLRNRLSDAMGEMAIAWLSTLPLKWRSGNVWAVHAGADPALPMTEQPEDVLLWGHSAFRYTPRSDGQWVVHGHTIVDAAQIQSGRIALDTGAYATGRLSAAGISADGVDFMRTGAA